LFLFSRFDIERPFNFFFPLILFFNYFFFFFFFFFFCPLVLSLVDSISLIQNYSRWLIFHAHPHSHSHTQHIYHHHPSLIHTTNTNRTRHYTAHIYSTSPHIMACMQARLHIPCTPLLLYTTLLYSSHSHTHTTHIIISYPSMHPIQPIPSLFSPYPISRYPKYLY